jgi:hypothetical protein
MHCAQAFELLSYTTFDPFHNELRPSVLTPDMVNRNDVPGLIVFEHLPGGVHIGPGSDDDRCPLHTLDGAGRVLFAVGVDPPRQYSRVRSGVGVAGLLCAATVLIDGRALQGDLRPEFARVDGKKAHITSNLLSPSLR